MEIDRYFKEAMKQEASDLYLIGGEVPVLRINGELTYLSPKLNNAELTKTILDLLTPLQKKSVC